MKGMTWSHQSSGKIILDAAWKWNGREQSWDRKSGWEVLMMPRWPGQGSWPWKPRKGDLWETTQGWRSQNGMTSVGQMGEKKTSRMPSSFLAWETRQTAVSHWGHRPKKHRRKHVFRNKCTQCRIYLRSRYSQILSLKNNEPITNEC